MQSESHGHCHIGTSDAINNKAVGENIMVLQLQKDMLYTLRCQNHWFLAVMFEKSESPKKSNISF